MDYPVTGALFDISIHALLAESDENSASPIRPRNYFYPRSPCGERRARLLACSSGVSISIHALLAESDLSRASRLPPVVGISIHALLAESDLASYSWR